MIDRRVATGKPVPWFRHPAWVSLFLLLLGQLCTGAYLYGELVSKVTFLEEQNRTILNVLLNRSQQSRLQ